MTKQIPNLARLLFLAFGILAVQIVASAQEEPLNLEWVQEDVKGVGALLRLMPIDKQNIAALKKQLNEEWGVEDELLGFGAHRVSFSKGYGYSSAKIDVFTFRGEVAYYEISIDGSSEKWGRYREKIVETWLQNSGPEFTEISSSLFYKRKFENVFENYFRAVRAYFGDLKPADVPSDLNESYEYLLSPMENSIIGDGVCGLGGPVLEGRASIDAFVEAGRIDLIENVLRGYNPGGRVYAVIALLKLEKQGLRLSRATKATIEKILNLKIPVTTCSGCIVIPGQRARDVVKNYLK